MSTSILAFFCRLIRFYFITVHTKVCVLKATIVACAFLVEYFESATLVAYAGLRVKKAGNKICDSARENRAYGLYTQRAPLHIIPLMSLSV